MAATHVVTGTVGVNTVTASTPAGINAGDLMVLVAGKKGNNSAFGTVTGFTNRGKFSNTNDTLQVWTRVATGSEAASYSLSGVTADAIVIIVYRGVLTDVPDDLQGAGSGATTPTLTPTATDDLVLYIQGATTNVSPTLPTGFTAARVNQFVSSIFHIYVADLLDQAASSPFTVSTNAGASSACIGAIWLSQAREVDPSFISSVTVVNAPTLVGVIAPPFIGSATAVYAPSLVGVITVPFIGSVTVLYGPSVTAAALDVPFIGSATVVYAPTLIVEILAPFIASQTHVWSIFSLFDPTLTYGGPGNGGESFLIRLNANGVTDTATLAASIGVGGVSTLLLTGDGAFPTDKPFVITIDDEVLLVYQIAPGNYHIRLRGVSNTTASSHTAGATVAWGDSYDMAITAARAIAGSFTADINSTGSVTYPGWLICFDSTQAYDDTGARYPMHVTQLLGVFDAGAGSSGSSRCDGAQPSAIHTPTGVSDDCPAALCNPARIANDINVGDVAVLRYTNPEATVLDLGGRSTALQSWFGLKRVSTSDADVTFTDPNGIVVDTTGTYDTFTGSVNDEWGEPIPLLTGIAPDASDAAGAPIDTPNPVPWTTVTLPHTDRFFTLGSGHGGYDEKGWPMGCLAVRQGNRRIPYWQSWDWHDYAYVYDGFGTDCTFAQILINRNGILFSGVPSVDLPNNQDIDGPDAVWDDPAYFVGASWYVAIFSTPYLVFGPSIGGTVTGVGGGATAPSVDFGGGTTPGGGSVTVPPSVEGGSGGGIDQPLRGLHVWQKSGGF